MMEVYQPDLTGYYDKYAASRNASPRDDWKCSIRAYYLDFLKTRKAGSVLEIGAGTGQDSEFFRQSGLQVTAIDLSPESIRLCKKRGVNAQVMDFYHMTFRDHEFDSMYAFNCLYHVPSAHTDAVFRELARVIKPGGCLLTGQRGGNPFEGWYQVPGKPESRYSVIYEKEEYKKMLQPHFRLVESHVLPVRNYEFHWFILEKPNI